MFSTPVAPGQKGSLIRLMYFRDDTRVKNKPFKKSLFWLDDGINAVVNEVDYAKAKSIIFPFETQSKARGYTLTNHSADGLYVTVDENAVLDYESLAEGGDEAKYYKLQQDALLHVIKFPEQGTPIAAKWRMIYRLTKRIVILTVTYDGETLTQLPQCSEYTFD